MTSTQSNLSTVIQDLTTILKERLNTYFQPENQHPPFQPNGQLKDWAAFLNIPQISKEEYTAILMGLATHIQPHFFDTIIQEYMPNGGDFPQFGGVRGKNFRGFLPTGETVLFVLAGEDLEKRTTILELFSPDHFFNKKHILWLEDTPPGEPRMSGKIILSPEYVELLTTSKVSRPRFSLSFPAQLLETKMEWDDLVLSKETFQQIRELETWLKHGNTLMEEWGMARKLKPGYRVLFHGPPGTGKTLTASLLGKYTGRDVFRIDLSMIVSKFIGETEKNLSNLFAKAENKDWILFFDEADALFGKRTSVKDAHDKYANQEVSYLLQRVETYNGLVILATNFKSNIDEAFTRRFQSFIAFQLPRPAERLKIWEKAFPLQVKLADDVQLSTVAQNYEVSGAQIMNVVQYCCLHALENETNVVAMKDIQMGVRKEFNKEGRIMR